MEKSVFDMAVDILVERQQLVRQELAKRFKGVKPFGMEKVSDEQRISEYNEWAGTPMEAELRQQFGDAEIDKTHLDMHELRNRRLQQNA